MRKVCLAIVALRWAGCFPLALHPKRRHSDLKRVTKNVYQLNKDAPSWNVDGSSDADRPSSSWIGHWEQTTGLKRGYCSYCDCNNFAAYGGHVWLKGRGVFIAPLCKSCNSHWNAGRAQNREGRHSFLRKGTTVVRAEYSDGMKNADRRLSTYEKEPTTRRCIDCSADISDQPDSHTRCLRCFRSSRGCAAKRRGRRENRTGRCINCGTDISGQPESHRRCPRCFGIMRYYADR